MILPDSSEAAPAILDEILSIVRTRRGIDFAGYRRGTLERRLANRLLAAGEPDARRYLDRLRASDEEIDRLIEVLTIKVSRFYRNAEVFDALRDDLLPELAARFAPARLRAWSAGCGRGEEAYTLAMLLDEAGGTVDATDIDEAALVVARTGRYGPDAFAELPAALLRFVRTPPEEPAWSVVPALQRRVHFAHHDLGGAARAPGGQRYHLVCCRNVLIYFDASLQGHANRLLIDSLVPGGLLCLGEAEWLTEYAAQIEPVDRKLKVFRRR
ncbi:MAG TPA: protein-glutamate O-methyltransferase CheR [Methylomirabilota bacterium]|nr:protein-glutamate O-methyltransferase CheR [Methylomirabilota bacterium]